MNGLVIKIFYSGSLEAGVYKIHKMEGFGIKIFPSITIEAGMYKNDKCDGVNMSYFSDESKRECGKTQNFYKENFKKASFQNTKIFLFFSITSSFYEKIFY